MTFRSRKTKKLRRHMSQQELAALEREVLSDDDLIEHIDRELGNPVGDKNPDWTPGGPVLLDKPMQRLHRKVDWELSPGARWSVDDAQSVTSVALSAVATNYVQVFTPRSRVVLPDGVRA